jgi:hypothetical protein
MKTMTFHVAANAPASCAVQTRTKDFPAQLLAQVEGWIQRGSVGRRAPAARVHGVGLSEGINLEGAVAAAQGGLGLSWDCLGGGKQSRHAVLMLPYGGRDRDREGLAGEEN